MLYPHRFRIIEVEGKFCGNKSITDAAHIKWSLVVTVSESL